MLEVLKDPLSQAACLRCTSYSFLSLGWVMEGQVRRPSGHLVTSLQAHGAGHVLAWYTVGAQKPELLSPASLPQNRHLTGKTSLPPPKDNVATAATSNYTHVPSPPSLTALKRGLRFTSDHDSTWHEAWQAMTCCP